jgi:hypothetical protein
VEVLLDKLNKQEENLERKNVITFDLRDVTNGEKRAVLHALSRGRDRDRASTLKTKAIS